MWPHPLHKMEGGWGRILGSVTTTRRWYCFRHIFCDFFFPTHWPLGQEPPNALLFRVYILNLAHDGHAPVGLSWLGLACVALPCLVLPWLGLAWPGLAWMQPWSSRCALDAALKCEQELEMEPGSWKCNPGAGNASLVLEKQGKPRKTKQVQPRRGSAAPPDLGI